MTPTERGAIVAARDALRLMQRFFAQGGGRVQETAWAADRSVAALDALLAAPEAPDPHALCVCGLEYQDHEDNPLCRCERFAAPCPGCAARDARIETLCSVVGRCHRAMGEDPGSDDDTLPDMIAQYISERDARIAALERERDEARVKAAEKKLAALSAAAEAERERDEALEYAKRCHSCRATLGDSWCADCASKADRERAVKAERDAGALRAALERARWHIRESIRGGGSIRDVDAAVSVIDAALAAARPLAREGEDGKS